MRSSSGGFPSIPPVSKGGRKGNQEHSRNNLPGLFIYRQERPELKLLQRDFLTIQPEETGLFDAVAMNPPFHMRADIRHIMHARKFLKPGGIIAALCMDTHHREEALRPIASTWEKIPAGTFKGEGTMIASVLLTIKA